MADEMVTMVADMTHGGAFGTVRKGGTYQVTEREARRIEERTPHLARRATAKEAAAAEKEAESAASSDAATTSAPKKKATAAKGK